MSQTSLTRKFARVTRRFRAALGLAQLDPGPTGSVPFRRALAHGKPLPARVGAIENDLDRLILGWNQHLPQILGTVAEARQMAQHAQASQGEVEDLRLRVAALEATIAALETRTAAVPEKGAKARRVPSAEAEPSERPLPRMPRKTLPPRRS